MSTRCQLRFVQRVAQTDGQNDAADRIAQIYRHSDGYPASVLRDLDRLKQLLAATCAERAPGYTAAVFVFLDKPSTVDLSLDDDSERTTDAALATITDDTIPLTDGGQPVPSLPTNWRTVSRPDRRVFQRTDCDHYIVLGEGVDEWLIVLCSQGDRAYPAPLAHRTVAVDSNVEQVIGELVEESNNLVKPPNGVL